MQTTWSRPLVALLLVAAFATLALLPPDASGPREGRLLTWMDIEAMAAGESAGTNFLVDDFYDSIELNYNITAAAHVRAALVEPSGLRHNAVANAATNTLTLSAATPMQGHWRLEIWTLHEPGRQGFVQHGNFTVLGFGGTLRFV